MSLPSPVSQATARRIARQRRRLERAARAVRDTRTASSGHNLGGNPLGPHAANPNAGSGSTTRGPLPGTTAPGTGYDWGDGRKVHSISREDHAQHVRDRQDANSPLYNPTQQLSGTSLRDAANSLVDLEFGPQRAALQRELDNATTQGTALAQRASDYSAQMGRSDAAVPGQVAAIGNLLKQAVTNNGTEATNAINATLADATNRTAADQAVRGGVGAAIANEGAKGEQESQLGLLAANQAAAQNAAAAQSANFEGLARLSGTARAQMGAEVQGQLLNRLANNQADVRARQSDLAKSEGDARAAKLVDLRQQAFENLITQRGLDIKTSELEAQTAEGKAKLEEQAKSRRQRARDNRANREMRSTLDRRARSERANAINEVGISNKDWLKMTPQQRRDAIVDFKKREHDATTDPRAPKDKAKEKELASSFTTKSNINSMITDISTDKKLIPHRYENGPRLVQILVNRGADPLQAQAAVEIARHGAITPATERKLRQAGVRIPPSWRGTAPTGRDAQPG